MATCKHTDFRASTESISCGDGKGVTRTVTTGVQDAGFGAIVATTAELTGVLSSVDGMFITADTVPGLDGICMLDNPTIYTVPAPGAVVLLGLASIIGARRRRSTRG